MILINPEFIDADIGGDKFFALVQSMPDPYEALQLIDLARLHFSEKISEEHYTGPERAKIQYTMQKLNTEKKRLNGAIDQCNTRIAIIELFGQDAWNQVRNWIIEHRKDHMV